MTMIDTDSVTGAVNDLCHEAKRLDCESNRDVLAACRDRLYELELRIQSERAVLDARLTTGDPLSEGALALIAIGEQKKHLDVRKRELEERLANLIPYGGTTVTGVGRLRVRKKTSRTEWDKDALLSAVLDSRRPVDRETGEVDPRDQNPLEKVLDVWNLGAPRSGVLADRGIDADDFAHVEDQGRTVQIQRSEDEQWI